MAGEAFASAGSDLVSTPPVGTLVVAPQPTGGQGLALDPTGNLPLAVRKLLPGYLYGYQEFIGSVSITATTEATANTIVTAPAIVLDGVSPVEIRFFAFEAVTSAANVQLNFWLYDGSSSIGELAALFDSGSTVADQVVGSRFLTPSSGSHTYSVRASIASAGTATVFAGPGGAGNDVPGFIRVTRS